MKSMLSAAALAAAALCASAPATAAITFTFTPAQSHIAIGEGVAIEARIAGLGDEVLSAFDLNFNYDASLLRWTLIEYFGANLGANLGLNDNGLPNGNLGVDDTSLEDDVDLASNQANDFLLFRFTLLGTADGVTDFTLGASPDFARNFVGLGAESLVVDVGSACIAVGTGVCGQVQPAPEPASYGLAAIALLAAGVAGRRRRAAAA